MVECHTRSKKLFLHCYYKEEILELLAFFPEVSLIQS